MRQGETDLARSFLNTYVQSVSATTNRIHAAALKLFAEKGVTSVTVSELADAAGIARGTIYNNVASVDSLFEDVAGELILEMHRRLEASSVGIDDPVLRLANGARYYLWRAHDEPTWGRFINRFALSSPSLQALWSGQLRLDLVEGARQGRYDLEVGRLQVAMSFIAGGVLAGMLLVLDGHRTWRKAGPEVAELILRSLGIARQEARALATRVLPPLLEVDVSA
ncbi:TetR/AcrR family transcriptional regulator [soil metagenome]